MLVSLTSSLPLADFRGGDALPVAIILAALCIGLVIGLGIQALVCYYLSEALKRLPPEYRRQEPGMVWLLMIPLFSIVWNFFVYPKISESYQAYFAAQAGMAQGIQPMPGLNPGLNYSNPQILGVNGDCGHGLGLAFCILVCCGFVPYLNMCTGIAALVVWIIYLVKISGLKAQVPPGLGEGFGGGAPINRV
jgi:hypothetical protein